MVRLRTGNQKNMHPEFIDVPIIGIPIKMYGFCLMVGFLSAVWLCMKRAERVKADPDIVLDMAFLALIFGVGGARLFYVVHYWHPQFSGAPNKFLAVINITQGGLEFLGGFLGAALAMSLYTIRKKASLRLYLDIFAPGVMWGLAFGRIGCFFNGCCFGGLCTLPNNSDQLHTQSNPAYAWAVQFPFGSPAHIRQWEDRVATIPAELLQSGVSLPLSFPIAAEGLSMSVEKREKPIRDYEKSQKAYEQALAGNPNSDETAALKKELVAVRKIKDKHEGKLRGLRFARQYPSREVPARRISVSELEDLAKSHGSVFIHPTQLYSSIHAMLLSIFLALLFRIRKRHGLVVGVLFMMYPIPRMILEIIRVDNPIHAGGLTASQWVGLGMVVSGAAYLVLLCTKFPKRSPMFIELTEPTK